MPDIRGFLSDTGITARIICALSASSAMIFAVVFYMNYTYASRMVKEQVMAHSRDVVTSAVQNIDDILLGVTRNQAILTGELERLPRLTGPLTHSLLRSHLIANDEIYGSTAAFDPVMSPVKNRRFAPYYFRRQNGTLAFSNLASPSYGYETKEWYRHPSEQKSPVWSEPYFDDGGGNTLMTTYSVPFYRPYKGIRKFAGIATADVSLDWLARKVSSLRLYNNGYAVLFSQKGAYLAHPERSLVMKETIFSVAEKYGNAELKSIGEAIKRREMGFSKTRNIYGIESWIYYSPVPSTGWSLAVVFPASEMLADVRKTSRMIALYCGGGFLFLLLTISMVSRSITRPLVEITNSVGLIAGGNLDVPLPGNAGGEIGKLARAFGTMQHDLDVYIRQLTEATAARERMESELTIARSIQDSFLPSTLPDMHGLKMDGRCIPAKEVGGDFYDIVDLGSGRLFFIIGDVSGKGVPAALYMAASVTLARALAREGLMPAQLLGRLNSELAQRNDSSMFVTVFCGCLDTATGILSFSNAGHNPPVIIEAGGKAAYLKTDPGIVAGYLDEYAFRQGEVRLTAGSAILLYTDGVTEAENSAGDFLGEQRFLDSDALAETEPRRMLEGVDRMIKAFSLEAPQSDDITLLAIKFEGS